MHNLGYMFTIDNPMFMVDVCKKYRTQLWTRVSPTCVKRRFITVRVNYTCLT